MKMRISKQRILAAFLLVVLAVSRGANAGTTSDKRRRRRPRRKEHKPPDREGTTASSPKLSSKLITPTLWPLAPDNLGCNLSNVGPKTKHALVRIISQGEVLLDSGTVSIEPRHTYDAVIDGLEKGGPVYCEFSVEGSTDDFSGSIKIFPTATVDISPDATDFKTDTDIVALPAT